VKNRDGETLAEGPAADDGVTTGRLPEFAFGAWDDEVVEGGVMSGVVSASGAKAGDSDFGRSVEAPGERGAGASGERLGLKAAGPGAARGDPAALHWRGTPGMLQARGSEMARVRLMGTWNGLPEAIRHIQSVPLLVMDWRELQQAGVGGAPAALLLVTKFIHGAKLVSMVGEQAELIWA